MKQFKHSFHCPIQLELSDISEGKLFCGQCSKQVNDLRGKSDQEVENLLNAGETCVIIEPQRIKPANWWFRAAIGITSFLALQTIQLKAQFINTLDAFNVLDYSKQRHQLAGKVVDSRGEPIEHAQIEIKDVFGEVIVRVKTGSLGLFRIEVPYSQITDRDPLTLIVYASRRAMITKRTTMALLKKEDLCFDVGEEHYYQGGIPALRYRIEKISVRIADVPKNLTKPENITLIRSDIKFVSGGGMND